MSTATGGKEKFSITKILGVIYFDNGKQVLKVGLDQAGNLISHVSKQPPGSLGEMVSVYSAPDRRVISLITDSDAIDITVTDKDVMGNRYTRFVLKINEHTYLDYKTSALAKDILIKDTVVKFTGANHEYCALSLSHPEIPSAQLLFLLSGVPGAYDSGSALSATFTRIANGFKSEYQKTTVEDGHAKYQPTFFNQVSGVFTANQESGFWAKVLPADSSLAPVLEALVLALAIICPDHGQTPLSSKRLANRNPQIDRQVATNLIHSALEPRPTQAIKLKRIIGFDTEQATPTNILHLLIPNLDDPARPISPEELNVSRHMVLALLDHIGINKNIRRDVIQTELTTPAVEPSRPPIRQTITEAAGRVEPSISDSWQDYQIKNQKVIDLFEKVEAAEKLPTGPEMQKIITSGHSDLDNDVLLDLLALLHHAFEWRYSESTKQNFVNILSKKVFKKRKEQSERDNIDFDTIRPRQDKRPILSKNYHLMEDDGRISNGWYVTDFFLHSAIVQNDTRPGKVMVVSNDELKVMESAFGKIS